MNRAIDETSEALIAAAHRLLAASGAEALTVRRIANEAGMSTMNVYSRFGGKDGVIDALYTDGFRRLLGALEAVETTADCPADLARVAAAFRAWAIDNPAYYGIMFSSRVPGFEPSPSAEELTRQALAHITERVRSAQAAGAVTEAMEAIDAAAFLWGTCHGMISFELEQRATGAVQWPRVYDRGIRLALAALDPAVVPVEIG